MRPSVLAIPSSAKVWVLDSSEHCAFGKISVVSNPNIGCVSLGDQYEGGVFHVPDKGGFGVST